MISENNASNFDRTYRQFLGLVKSAIWNIRPDVGLYKGCEWRAIRCISEMQTVQGLIADGIGMLPKSCMPEMATKFSFIANASAIERRNHKVNQEMLYVAELLEEAGVRVVFFKGRIAASRYPSPSRRTPGDVDFITDNPQKAERLLIINGGRHIATIPKHSEIMFHNVSFESHRILLDMAYPPSLSFTRRLSRQVFSGQSCYETIDGSRVGCLSATLEVCHCAAHINHHFLEVGIGLRQLVDFTMLLHHRRCLIDTVLLETYLKSLHMRRFFNALTAACVDYLGLPETDVMFTLSDLDRRNSRLIFQNIVNCGNFGRYGLDKPTAHVRAGGQKTSFENPVMMVRRRMKSNNYVQLLMNIRNSARYFSLSPMEALFRPTVIPKVWLQTRFSKFMY